MNAMNQIAARDISLSGTENPLLFALSDYLREALSRLEMPVVSIRNDARIMEAHLLLHGCVAHGAVTVSVEACPPDVFRFQRGTLCMIALHSLKAVGLPVRSECRLHLKFRPVARDDEQAAFSMIITDDRMPADVSADTLIRRLAEIPAVRSGGITVAAPVTAGPPGALVVDCWVRLAH
ncbi:MAG: hypothetical protein Q7T87_04375 [Polaromonas sp.]|nr:hypothetical protein [Polaromonas sp.]